LGFLRGRSVPDRRRSYRIRGHRRSKTGLPDRRRLTGGELGNRLVLVFELVFPEIALVIEISAVVHALKRDDDSVPVSDLATDVTAWEQNIPPEEVVHEDRRHVYSALRRTHLPKLDDADVIEYDPESNLVEPTESLQDLDIYIEVLRGREIPWSVYYVDLAGVAVALTVAVSLDVMWFGRFTPLNVGVFVVVAFGISAAVHHYYGERARLGNERKPPELRQRK